MNAFNRPLAAALALLLTVSACSGSSGGSVPAGPEHAGGSTAGRIHATVYVPPKKHQSAGAIRYLKAQQSRHSHGRRKPHYFSGATTEIDFVLNTVAGVAATSTQQTSFNFVMYMSDTGACSGNGTSGYTCQVTEPAPAGADTYLVRAQQCSASGTGPSTACSAAGGALTLLSASYVPITVIAYQTVAAAFTLSPVVGSIDWAPVTYARISGGTALPSSLWFTNPGDSVPAYNPSPAPGTYTCKGSGSTGCYEPVVQGTSVAYGVVLETRDPNGALIIGASNGGTIYQTPVYLDPSGNAISVSWSCLDEASGATAPGVGKSVSSLAWSTGGGPYNANASAPLANATFNSPIANPAADPDGGNTTDANGNPVTAVGNNGTEMEWDGIDVPLQNPDYCKASTSNGLTTALDWYAGLGVAAAASPTPSPSPSASPTPLPIPTPSGTPDGSLFASATVVQSGSPNINQIVEFASGGFGQPPSQTVSLPVCGGCGQLLNTLAFDPSGNLWALAMGSGGCASTSLLEYSGQPVNGAVPNKTVVLPEGSCNGISFDSQGYVYIAGSTGSNPYNDFVGVLSIGASGSASVVRTISGPDTQLETPVKTYIDGAGDLWVLNSENCADHGQCSQGSGLPLVLEFAPNATGDATPIKALFSQQWFTQCNIPGEFNAVGMVFDAAGNLVVMADSDGSAPFYDLVWIVPSGFGATTCPSDVFVPVTGTDTTGDSVSLAADDQGYLYVGDSYGGPLSSGSIDVYAEGAANSLVSPATPYASFELPAGYSAGALSSALALSTFSGWYSGTARRRIGHTAKPSGKRPTRI